MHTFKPSDPDDPLYHGNCQVCGKPEHAGRTPAQGRAIQALRWLAGPCDLDTTPGHRCWLPGENRTPDAPYSAYRWCESCTAAYGLGEGPVYPPPPSRSKDSAAGLRGTVARLQSLDENGRPL